ncbi:MAG TPA: RNA polymerase sigma factor [Bacteroidia bacterium]|jgi:RNA polymerase sigma factor (sigma-70 family)|nr:RNA polymerase sigma factor [Bacteroidia bacterium]
MIGAFDEVKLIENCIKGDRNAQALLFKTFSGKMFPICLSYSKNADAAKDILQDGFIKIFDNLKFYSRDFPLERWIRKIIVNTAIDAYRKSVKMVWVKYEYIEDIIPSEVEDVYSKINEKQLLETIKGLPEGYKMVFNLYVVEGYSHKEISEMLDISEGTSKSQFFHAKKMLRERINELYNDKILADEIPNAINNGQKFLKVV